LAKTSNAVALGLALSAWLARAARADEYEPRGLPILGGNSDIGMVLGAAGQLVKTAKDCAPYCWKLQVQALASFRAGKGDFEVPLQNHFIKHEMRSVLRNTDVDFRIRFEQQGNIGYFGIGNASASLEDAGKRYHQYKRVYPGAYVGSRYHFLDVWSVFGGLEFRHNLVHVYEGSRLEADVMAAQAGVGPRIAGIGWHPSTVGTLGVRLETTQIDVDPVRGFECDTSVRFAPDPLNDEFGYTGLNVTLRTYVPLYEPRVVLALRLVGDTLLGDPPVYELARYGGFDGGLGPGGSDAIRGVPNGRYHARWKLFGNAELRFVITRFTVLKQKLVFGTTLFFDAGRVWSELPGNPSLDHGHHPLKYGFGSGATVKWGRHFLLRLEGAWSPDASPVGIYFNIGHSF
jgi:hypothetical protein